MHEVFRGNRSSRSVMSEASPEAVVFGQKYQSVDRTHRMNDLPGPTSVTEGQAREHGNGHKRRVKKDYVNRNFG